VVSRSRQPRAHVLGGVERAQRVRCLDHATIARIAGARRELLQSIAGVDDAERLQQRGREITDDRVLGDRPVGAYFDRLERPRPRDGAVVGIEQQESHRRGCIGVRLEGAVEPVVDACLGARLGR
jgi:hypothetical protein